ncbi:MAG: LysR family transcriptional regulator [Rhizobiaceae bacterium]
MKKETINHLDLSTLEIFRQVAREGSISSAAKNLNRVQSNVSTRIKQIEDQIGVSLFERGRRGMALTDSGHTLLGYANELLTLSEQAVEAVGIVRPAGVLRIGAMESTAASRLPVILTRFHDENPNVEVHVRTDTAGAIIGHLMSGQIDVAFVAEPVELRNIIKQPVFRENLILITPKSFPGSSIRDLTGKTMIAFEEGCAYRRYLNQWLLENGIVPEKTISIGSYLGMFACISAGTGFGVVPESVLDVLGMRNKFQCRKLGGKYANITTMKVSRAGYQSSKLSALSNMLSEANVTN